MPHIKVSLLEGKTEEQKQQLAAALVKAAQGVLGLGDDSYSVAIHDFTMEDWKETVYPDAIMKQEDKLFKKPGYTM